MHAQNHKDLWRGFSSHRHNCFHHCKSVEVNLFELWTGCLRPQLHQRLPLPSSWGTGEESLPPPCLHGVGGEISVRVRSVYLLGGWEGKGRDRENMEGCGRGWEVLSATSVRAGNGSSRPDSLPLMLRALGQITSRSRSSLQDLDWAPLPKINYTDGDQPADLQSNITYKCMLLHLEQMHFENKNKSNRTALIFWKYKDTSMWACVCGCAHMQNFQWFQVVFRHSICMRLFQYLSPQGKFYQSLEEAHEPPLTLIQDLRERLSKAIF